MVNGTVGLYLAAAWDATNAETGVVESIVGALGFFGVILVFVSQTRINTANYYLTTSNVETLIRDLFRIKVPRWASAICVRVAASSLMLTDVISTLLKALGWQGVFVTAWVAIALVYIGLPSKRDNPAHTTPSKVPALASVAIIWLAASVVGILLLEGGSGVWPQLAPVITAAIAATGYLVAQQFNAANTASAAIPDREDEGLATANE